MDDLVVVPIVRIEGRQDGPLLDRGNLRGGEHAVPHRHIVDPAVPVAQRSQMFDTAALHV